MTLAAVSPTAPLSANYPRPAQFFGWVYSHLWAAVLTHPWQTVLVAVGVVVWLLVVMFRRAVYGL